MTQTALLSTTIQALMLSARIIDPRDRPGISGTRVFAFTDKLDIANRLFHFYSDAEGWGSFGKPADHEPLAALRSPDRVDSDRDAARAAGQVWDGPTEIGHDLSGSRVRVGLTTSQQAGVQDREVIVATASLEVGYNDENVGLVMQHKAPRDPASFLQRRGRAGRRREQRPWTVVVLSDYGRDRIAYHSYEQLFDPALPARSLPIGNLAVRRMQATFATLDWLSRIQPSPKSVWDELTRPTEDASQQKLAGIIEQVLADEDLQTRLRSHLCAALDVEGDEVDPLLWTSPRGILTEVLPTARRRLLTGWSHFGRGRGEDLQAPTSPLPDFVPPNLFTDLQLPEVTITTPKRKESDEVDEHALSVLTALTEFAPGNVSFRFASVGPWAAGWVPIDAVADIGDQACLDLATFCATFDDLGMVGPPEAQVRMIRPWRIRTVRRPSMVLDSSRGFLRWSGGPIPSGPGSHVDLPSGTKWERVLRRAEMHLHAAHTAVKVRRYAATFTAEVGHRGGERESIQAAFALHGEPAAIGFEYDADALAFYLELPSETLLPTVADRERLAAFRSAWFARLLQDDQPLRGIASVFQCNQLERAFLAAVADEAIDNDRSLAAAIQLTDDALRERLRTALDVLYGTQEVLGAPQRGLEELKDLVGSETVIRSLRNAARALTEDLSADAHVWAKDRFVSSMAAALADAGQALCREFDFESDVVVDVTPEPDERYVVWLTERSPGGGGVVEALTRRMLERPRHFLALLDRAARPSDFEVIDRSLADILAELIKSDSRLAELFAGYRVANSNASRTQALEAIRHELPRCGVQPVHAVMAAIAARLLRFGATAALDQAMQRLTERWNSAEGVLGIELEPAVFAFTERRRSDFDALVPMGHRPTEHRRVEIITSSLWMRGWRARAEGLQTYSPFWDPAPTDRLALDHFRGAVLTPVDLENDDWRAQADLELRDMGTCVIAHRDARRVADAIRAVTVTPTDVGVLLLHPTVVALEATARGYWATLILDDGAVA
jgi:hypothetical protein